MSLYPIDDKLFRGCLDKQNLSQLVVDSVDKNTVPEAFNGPK